MTLLSNEPCYATNIHGALRWSPIRQVVLVAVDPMDLDNAVNETMADRDTHIVAISAALPSDNAAAGIVLTQTILYQSRIVQDDDAP